MVACIFEKITFSRRWSHASSRRLRFLEDGRVHLQEDYVFSKMAACIFKKITFSRRWPRASSRRLRFLEDGRVHLQDGRIPLREDPFCSQFIESQRILL